MSERGIRDKFHARLKRFYAPEFTDMIVLEIRTMKLHFHESGQGEPLILLHGLLGSHRNWLPLAEKFSVHFRVFALDHRNHGASPHADEFDYDAMVADVVEFMRGQKILRANFIGHSMGGKAAMRLAQLHPTAVQRLVVADMSVHEYPARYAAMLDAMLALDLTQFTQRNEIDTAIEPVVASKTMRQFLLKNVGRAAAGNLFWKPNLAAIRKNYDRIRGALPTAGQFDGPTLFIRGAKSDYVRASDLDLIRATFPRAELKTIEDAGHWVHSEAPTQFYELARKFLRSLEPV